MNEPSVDIIVGEACTLPTLYYRIVLFGYCNQTKYSSPRLKGAGRVGVLLSCARRKDCCLKIVMLLVETSLLTGIIMGVFIQFVVWFALVHVFLLPVSVGLTVFLKGNGKDTPSCISEESKTACSSLPYISQQLSSTGIVDNVTIIVSSKSTFADAHFQGIDNLSIISNRYSTSLTGGLTFTNISGLLIRLKDVRKGGNTIANHSVVMRIQGCQDVTIKDTSFLRSKETSIFFEDTHGNVSLINVKFENNKNFETTKQEESHSGGIEILFTGNIPANYEIQDCTFMQNSAPKGFNSYDTTLRENSEWRGQSVGGGLGIYFKGNCSMKTVVMSNCNFTNNNANWGGGMHIIFQDQSFANHIEVRDSYFIGNKASRGGAGVCIRYFKSESRQDDNENHYNVIYFHHVMFEKNIGDFGGGLLVLSTYSPYPSTSKIVFRNCEWTKNEALYSSAVDIAPALFQRLNNIGHLPIPEFIGCLVKENVLRGDNKEDVTLPHMYTNFSGIFVLTKSIVYFSGEVTFEANSASALYINSGTVAFRSESNVVFAHNSGFRGGAIAAYGYSSILINKNSSLLFMTNFASEIGGAIYQHSFDQHDYKYGRMCFIRLEDPLLSHKDTKTTKITFANNSAGIMGMSIYSSTLYPCYFWTHHKLSVTRLDSGVLNFIGNVTFDNENSAIATNARVLNITNVLPEYRIIPGKLLNIPLVSINELDLEHTNIASYRVKTKNGNIKVDRQFTIQGNLRLSGIQGQNDLLEIVQETPRRLILHVNVTLLNCPPGFYHDSETLTCKCSLDGENSSGTFYYGISKCDKDEFYASIHQGFWIGYMYPITNHSPTNLYTAVCPFQFCDSTVTKLSDNSSELIDQVCNANRTGILCGDCKEGYSSFFHSWKFMCGPNSLCYLGFLFYFLSELLPIVVLFSMIIILDFSFTSGGINGFILYSQILDSLLVKFRTPHDFLNKLMVPSRVFYDIFNFDYFSTSSLSYCLWKNAKVMDILAFKYVTVIFAFILVICLILIMNKVKCSKIDKQRVSVINGLSAFLVICYAQCVRTSFYILTPVRLRTQGGIPGDTVALFGGMPFLEGRHLFYSVIAILCILTVVAIPPLVLLLYPLTLHFLALCKLSEHWVVSKLLSILMINRLKPLIDSFQGCYKDRLRFFSGLYFLYRVMILACFSIAHSTSQFYIISQFLLTIFLGVHSVAQPYRKRLHNLIDSLIFLLLVIINGCTIFTNVYNVQHRENYFAGVQNIKYLFIVAQLVLISLPMIVFFFWLGIKTFKLISKHITLPKIISKQRATRNAAEEDIVFCLEYRQLNNIHLNDISQQSQ